MTVRESRRTIAAESPLNPVSLVGSYCLCEGDFVWQGLVVAEPQPGVYLVEFYDDVTDEAAYQRVVNLEDMVAVDEGERWSFYDTRLATREAFKGLFRE